MLPVEPIIVMEAKHPITLGRLFLLKLNSDYEKPWAVCWDYKPKTHSYKHLQYHACLDMAVNDFIYRVGINGMVPVSVNLTNIDKTEERNE